MKLPPFQEEKRSILNRRIMFRRELKKKRFFNLYIILSSKIVFEWGYMITLIKVDIYGEKI